MRGTGNWCVADFETKTEKFYLENGYTEVWLWSISSPTGKIMGWGDNIDTFFKYCKDNLKGYTVYFHNLKFDGSFILNWIINNNIEYKDKIYSKDSRCYNTLISEEGQFYQITIHFQAGITVIFQDSLKILPFPVSVIAKSFNLPMLKGCIDYDDYTINDETLEYVFNDVKIVALALKEIKENGMLNMTTASCAYHNFSKDFPFMNSYFPILDEQFLIEYRQAYRGGRSQVNPDYENVICHNVKRFDVNSMYPYIMHDMELPYGKPIKCKEMGKYKFELYKMNITFKLKEGHLPTLLKKNVMFGEGSYYIESDIMECIYISNIDFEILKRHYNIEFMMVQEIWGFNTTTSIFKRYIDKWYAVKNTTTGGKRIIAKLMLNSLYGKFGSNCKGKSKIPYLDEDGILCFKNTEEQDMRKYYLPMAIAIVSYAHLILDDAIVATGVDKFVYCDTDSVHTLGDLPIEMIDNTILGKFKLEGVELTSKYVRQKTYVYTEYNKKTNEIEYNITCAGMDSKTKDLCLKLYGDDIFKVFQRGFTIEGCKLMPEQVKGGIILRPTSFQIRN